ncbi:MAG TPA: hypothetical protein VGG25_31305 [Streptosporangiaceae bacterium]|jgi:hypothetical protein
MSISTESIPPVRVHVTGSDVPAAAARTGPVYESVYETFVLTANDPVQCILPQDERRVIAHIIALDNDVVIGVQGQAGAALNTAADTPMPIGALVPSQATAGAAVLYPVLDNGPVFAGATTTAENSRVSVSATYRK